VANWEKGPAESRGETADSDVALRERTVDLSIVPLYHLSYGPEMLEAGAEIPLSLSASANPPPRSPNTRLSTVWLALVRFPQVTGFETLVVGGRVLTLVTRHASAMLCTASCCRTSWPAPPRESAPPPQPPVIHQRHPPRRALRNSQQAKSSKLV
jgi:hypothetical protein